MIFTERTITVVNDSATINKPLILYRGDKNIELKITIVESQFKFRSTGASNVIETANASYAQLVINTPYDLPIFSEVTATENGTVIFVISAAMIDEVREVGIYDIQIRLLDDNKQSRVTIPPVSNAIEIREPMAIEDGSPIDSNAVNTARVNRALTTTSAPLEAFDSQGNYIKKTWGDGDPITDAALNKMEAGIDGVNKKIANNSSQIKEIVNVADLAQEGNNVYIKDSNGNKVGNGITIQTSGTSTSSVRLYNTEPIGELFDEPAGYTYLAWPAGNLKYDKNIDKYVCIINAADKHIFTTLKQYICFINPNTFEVSKLTEIVVTGTTLDQKAICNFTILDNGSYMIIALVNNVNHKIVSSDNGTTWTDAGAITGNTSQHFWAIYKLSNGRLIGSIDVANCGLWYSDDEGNSWANVIPSGTPGNYNAEGCIIELGNNKLMCVARKNMSGQGVNSSGDSDKAIISYSEDNGTSWGAWQESTSISMNASCCTATVHDNLVELFVANRWYHRGDYVCTEYINTGKNGAIKHYTATIENALLDNFTDNGVVVYANTPVDNSDTAQDFHCPCAATKGNDMLLVYFDRISPYISDMTNYYFVRGSLDGLDYGVKDNIQSTVFGYSSSHINKLLMVQKAELITLINEAILNSSPVVPDNPDNPMSYILDGIVYNFNFLNESKMDKTNMTLTDTINGIVGTFVTADGGSTKVSTFPTVYNNYMGNNYLLIPANTLNNYITETNYEFSIELGIYFQSTDEKQPGFGGRLYMTDGGGSNSTRISCNHVSATFLNTSGVKDIKGSSVEKNGYTGYKIGNNPGFHQVVVTYDNTGTISFYYNGGFVYSFVVPNFQCWHQDNITRAITLNYGKRYARMYKKVLSADEILSNYNYEKKLLI